jgi:hypothetical protein
MCGFPNCVQKTTPGPAVSITLRKAAHMTKVTLVRVETVIAFLKKRDLSRQNIFCLVRGLARLSGEGREKRGHRLGRINRV